MHQTNFIYIVCLWSQHPSSGVLNTVTAASGTGHNTGRVETESGGTRRRTGGEVKGKEANGVGSQQSSA